MSAKDKYFQFPLCMLAYCKGEKKILSASCIKAVDFAGKKYFEKQALAFGYEVLNMQPIFIERNRLDNSRFEFKTDGHWNELGHALVAEKIEESAVFKSTFPR